MAYVGNPIDTQNTFQSLVGKRFNGDGSTTAFTLDVAPSSTLDLEVFVGNVRQDPNSAYTLSGTTLTFTGAPPSGTNNIYVVHQAKSVGTIGIPDDTISARTLVTLDNSNDHVLIEDATDGELKKALIPAASFAGIDDQTSSNDDQLTITDTAVVVNEDSDDVDFRVESNGNANMLFVSGGNDVVGIGAEGDLGVGLHVKSADSGASVSGDADEAVFEASGHGGITLLNGTSHEGSINFGDSGDNDIGRLTYDHSANAMFMITNASIRAKIESDGDFLINRTSNNGSFPGKLSVLETTDNISILAENTKSSSLGASILKSKSSQDTTNSSYNLIDGHAPSGRFLVRDSGNVQNTNNSYSAISDERIKQNIADASSQWDDIKALKVRKFKLKQEVARQEKLEEGKGETNTSYQIGVVAQELETAGMNGLVEDAPPEKEDVAYHSDFGTIDGEGNFTAGQKVKSVKYSILYMKAIKALQESMTRIETLETEMTALKARVTTLEE